MHCVTFRLVFAFLLFLASPVQGAEDHAAPGISDEQLTALGTAYAGAINDGDYAALDELFDLRALASGVAKTVTSDRRERADFVKGFMRGAKNMTRQIIDQIHASSGHARFLGVRSFDGMRGSLVRYDLNEQGYNYVLLIGRAVANGEPRVVDMFIATNGVRLSTSLGAVTQLMIRPSESILETLFGSTAVDKKLVNTFVTLGRLQRERDFSGAYSMLGELPEHVRNHRVLVNFAVQLAAQINEELYRAELARLAEHFGDDPTAAFTLVDYYYYQGDMNAAMAALDNMERTFGADAAIYLLRANMSLAGGRTDEAIAFARAGLKLEPDNEDVYWTLVTALMSIDEYAQGIRVLEMLENRFGYVFEAANFGDNEVYSGFVKSSEFAAWSKGR